jgi:hypothetical protein
MNLFSDRRPWLNVCFCFYCVMSLQEQICALYQQQKIKSTELRRTTKNTFGNRCTPLDPRVSFPLRKCNDVNIFCVLLFTEISSCTWKSRTVGKNVWVAKRRLTQEDVLHQQESSVRLCQALTRKMAVSKSNVCIPYVYRNYTIAALSAAWVNKAVVFLTYSIITHNKCVFLHKVRKTNHNKTHKC